MPTPTAKTFSMPMSMSMYVAVKNNSNTESHRYAEAHAGARTPFIRSYRAVVVKPSLRNRSAAAFSLDEVSSGHVLGYGTSWGASPIPEIKAKPLYPVGGTFVANFDDADTDPKQNHWQHARPVPS